MAPRQRRKVKCDICKKEMFETNLARHKKTHEKKKEDKEPQKRPNRKSTNFFCTFQTPCKYTIVKHLKYVYKEDSGKRLNWIKALTIGNEWGSGYLPKGHAHALISTKDPGYSLEDMKKQLATHRVNPNDIQVAKSVKDSVRYISKEDYKCVSEGHDKDFLSVICRAYLYSLKYKKFLPTGYPYCALTPAQKKEFKEFLEQFYLEQELDNLTINIEKNDLYQWQKDVIQKLDAQNDRKILWLHDEEGGRGKTHLAKFLATKRDAMICHNASTKDVALAYQKQELVIFDYTRTEETINYSAIEHLKNGIIFSSKYQSAMKFFNPPKILCLSNNLPDLKGLSKDRWEIYSFTEEGELTQHDV